MNTYERLECRSMEDKLPDCRLKETLAHHFFDKSQEHDATLFRRLADNHAARNELDAADQALILHSPVLGNVRKLGSSWGGALIVGMLWLLPVGIWSCRKWPNKPNCNDAQGTGWIDRAVLALDLLLPDLVALGARERHKAQLDELSGFNAFLLAVYRLLGWGIISVILYVIIERAAY